MRTKSELQVAAKAFIETVTDMPAKNYMVDLLVAASLRRQNIPRTNNANALQTAASPANGSKPI